MSRGFIIIFFRGEPNGNEQSKKSPMEASDLPRNKTTVESNKWESPVLVHLHKAALAKTQPSSQPSQK